MYQEKYTNSNIIAKGMLRSFFKKIEKISYPIRNELHTILEIGCGHGYSTYELCKVFDKSLLVASDVDPELVQDAQAKNPTIKISTESVYQLNREDESFDLVILLEVLEHLSDPHQALRELYRVSKKYCIVSVPDEPLWRILNMFRGSYWSDLGNTPGHVNHWSKNQITRLMKEYFKTIKIVRTIPWVLLLVEKN
ncbi:MAG: class I SAM-dependent methyltransferase [Desulfobacula sp.]|nr:class I SAM-dependent methyltransferase [Desulfobacula sp.]